MSEGERVPLAVATAAATSIALWLQPFCERIEVAGSIRRGRETIGDVEIVAVPKTRHQLVGLFDDPSGPPIDCLHEGLTDLLRRGLVLKRASRTGRTAWGLKEKRLLWRPHRDWADLGPWAAGVPVDVWAALPTTFGAHLAIRTGPATWAKWLVTRRNAGGLCPDDMEFKDGAVWRYEGMKRRFVETPDEEALFRELGLEAVPPSERVAPEHVQVARR